MKLNMKQVALQIATEYFDEFISVIKTKRLGGEEFVAQIRRENDQVRWIRIAKQGWSEHEPQVKCRPDLNIYWTLFDDDIDQDEF